MYPYVSIPVLVGCWLCISAALLYYSHCTCSPPYTAKAGPLRQVCPSRMLLADWLAPLCIGIVSAVGAGAGGSRIGRREPRGGMVT